MTVSERATKRIPVTPHTWKIVHRLTKPGQTFDDLINELILRDFKICLIEETERILNRGTFIPLSEIKV